MANIGRPSPAAQVSTGDIADNSITSVKIAADVLTAADIAPNAVTASELADNAVDTAAIAADAVDGTKIADNAIDSEHVAADSLDAEHYAAGSVDGTAIANDAVDSQHYVADSVDTTAIAANAVTDTELNSAKLNAIEANADVTDATNVTAAGALMDSELADVAAVKATTGTFLTADQTKLDGIETSATADQTATELLTAIKTVDGSTSGLDAQYLSGNSSTEVGYNAKNISSTLTWSGQIQTGASGAVYEMCTHSVGFWGAGLVSMELWDYYYDTRATKYGHFLLRSHAHSSYGPASSIHRVSSGDAPDQSPYASEGPIYPSGLIGYWTFSLNLPSYQGVNWRIRAQLCTVVSSKNDCYGGGKIMFHRGGRI